ncbi:MAG: IMP cyclohydrolase [Butyrivibrio sp.]|nr:IMP cyclohydrolase [Butyrivibrio sp.]
MQDLLKELKENAYPGRGIIVGRSPDGRYAVTAYFIMGRSENSRNRIFVEDDGGIRTQAYDPALLKDPSLIIYAPVRVDGYNTIVTNGDQTDTIVKALEKERQRIWADTTRAPKPSDYETAVRGFAEGLDTREFEPDEPNYTPRISALMHVRGGDYRFAMSILKSDNGDPSSCLRYLFDYETPRAGLGRFLHTYMGDGNPLPSFAGEPEYVDLSAVCDWSGPEGGIDAWTEALWSALNEDNKVSLFTRLIDIQSGAVVSRIVNKHQS